MNIIIASDIHGSSYYCRRLIKAFNNEKADTLLLLGDILDGDREVAAMLNELNKTKMILCVRGNCDYPEDQAMLDFPIMAEYCVLFVRGRRIFAAHGNRSIPTLFSGDIYIHGHTHFPSWEYKDGRFYFSPGSVSEPRRGSKNSYMVLNDDGFSWKDLDGKVYNVMTLA